MRELPMMRERETEREGEREREREREKERENAWCCMRSWFMGQVYP